MPADEFEIIRNLFARYAKSEGARGLKDDAAVLEVSGRLVVTTDAIVEGVHFFSDDPIGLIAKKALRVNLSDLAAKGAKPVAILLTLAWPTTRPAAEIEAFVESLGEELDQGGIDLLGGDTVSTHGPLMISITAFGEPIGPRIPSRADAKPGEDVWVTGEIGEGYLGLLARTEEAAVADFRQPGRAGTLRLSGLIAHYCGALSREEFAPLIARVAGASADVSDGLIADLSNIAAASRVAIRIEGEAVPLSAEGRAFVEKRGAEGLLRLVTGGDDYQIVFTAAPEARAGIEAAARQLGSSVARIGTVLAGAGVVATWRGAALEVGAAGHRHRLGS
jgi:thiamine-monophosphate kinase